MLTQEQPLTHCTQELDKEMRDQTMSLGRIRYSPLKVSIGHMQQSNMITIGL